MKKSILLILILATVTLFSGVRRQSYFFYEVEHKDGNYYYNHYITPLSPQSLEICPLKCILDKENGHLKERVMCQFCDVVFNDVLLDILK